MMSSAIKKRIDLYDFNILRWQYGAVMRSVQKNNGRL